MSELLLTGLDSEILPAPRGSPPCQRVLSPQLDGQTRKGLVEAPGHTASQGQVRAAEQS